MPTLCCPYMLFKQPGITNLQPCFYKIFNLKGLNEYNDFHEVSVIKFKSSMRKTHAFENPYDLGFNYTPEN